MKTEYEKIQPFTTKDGSLVRELMHPRVHGNSQQSLAEAIVPVGTETIIHRHLVSEEIKDRVIHGWIHERTPIITQ